MDENDVGHYYTSDGKDIWELVSYCGSPSAVMANLHTRDRIWGAIGCRNLQRFVKLIPEGAIDNEEEQG